MKAFHFKTCEISSISSRKDKSLAFRVATGEIQPDQMAAFFPLTGVNVSLLIQPHENEGEQEMVEVTSEADKKSHSQRLRAALFVWWDQLGRKQPFRSFYEENLERIITKVKDKLD
jgi:hypothetical protein